ncbi:MAG: ribonuclease P protein component [Pseudanabaenaceae cyanobacterium]
MLPLAHRLHRRDFELIYERGDRFHSQYFKLRRWLDPTTTGQPARIGIVVSKKIAKLATQRNRLKRQIRAMLLPYLPQLKPDLQIIVTITSVTDPVSFHELAGDLHKLLLKAEVLEVGDGS